MLRRCLMVMTVAALAVIPISACGTGSSEPMPPDMPMEVAADTLSS